MAKSRKSPVPKARKLVGDQLKSPVLDWRSPPELVRLPEIDNLKKLDLHDLNEVLTRFGITGTWTELEQDVSRYIQRVSTRQWTRAELKAEVQRIAGVETNRGARTIAKRAYREYSQLHALGNDNPRDVDWIRHGEGGESQCDGCSEREGETGTLEHHASIGMPGQQECGEECLCTMTRFD